MSALLMTHLIPEKFIRPLKVLGKYEWVRWRPVDTIPPSTSIELRIPNDPALEEHTEFLQFLSLRPQKELGRFLELFGQSRLLADGPKVLRPTAEQCEALEHVDVNLSFGDYEQPFPVFLVEVPDRYRRQLTERFGHTCPRFVMNFHDRRHRYIICTCLNGPDTGSTFTILSPRLQWKSIEEALHLCTVEDGPDLHVSDLLYRIAINFGLLLTGYGAKDCGPVDPKAHLKQQDIARRTKGRKAERARRLLEATVNLIEFEQNVVFCDRPHGYSESQGEGTGRTPHWRRGHFRRQPCGTGRSNRRLTYVRPCFINADSFRGDRADTSYCIRVPERHDNQTAD